MIEHKHLIRQKFTSLNVNCGVVIDVLVSSLRFIENAHAAHQFPGSVLLDIIVNAPFVQVRLV
jgi:hypothetical protein